MYLPGMELVKEFQMLNAYTTIELEELTIPKHRPKTNRFIRPHSAPPMNFGLILADQFRLFSYIKQTAHKVDSPSYQGEDRIDRADARRT